jgi:hypothetical protein
LPDADRFFGQHYVSEPAPNRILVYDNGFARPGCDAENAAAAPADPDCYSRAVEYSVNAAANTATKVWEYRHSPKIYADLVGSAVRLSSGNTVVLFGMLEGDGQGSSGPRTAVEVNEAGVVRWRLNFVSANPSRIYRVTPAASLIGEQIRFPND